MATNTPKLSPIVESWTPTILQRISPNRLPKKMFELWLRDLVGTYAFIRWKVNNCGEQTGNPAAEQGRKFPLPMCVSASVDLENKHGLTVQLNVGTFESGVNGKPSFFNAVLVKPNGSQNWIKSLPELAEAIKSIK